MDRSPRRSLVDAIMPHVFCTAMTDFAQHACANWLSQLFQIRMTRAHRLRGFAKSVTQFENEDFEQNHLRRLEERTHGQNGKAAAAIISHGLGWKMKAKVGESRRAPLRLRGDHGDFRSCVA